MFCVVILFIVSPGMGAKYFLGSKGILSGNLDVINFYLASLNSKHNISENNFSVQKVR